MVDIRSLDKRVITKVLVTFKWDSNFLSQERITPIQIKRLKKNHKDVLYSTGDKVNTGY